jgi:hypothetical protein
VGIISSPVGTRGVENPTGIKHKGIDYKWIVLSITTIEMFMVSVNGSIILISLPAIFDGININPLTSFQFIGLILGGILAFYHWRYVFLVSVPVGILGIVWADYIGYSRRYY